MGPSVVILLCALTSVSGFFLDWFRPPTQSPQNPDPVIEHHETSVAEVIIAINREAHPPECYVIDVTAWSSLLDVTSTSNTIKAEIEDLIRSRESKRYQIADDDLRTYFKDEQGFSECRGHNMYLLDYIPSLAA